MSIIDHIVAQQVAPDMAAMLATRPHYFANTTTFLAPDILTEITAQIRAIESVIKSSNYISAVQSRDGLLEASHPQRQTQGAFMGYDFHITDEGPRLIEINSNAGGGLIVDMIEQTIGSSNGKFAAAVVNMFIGEWVNTGRTGQPSTVAIVDTEPTEQYHYPDMLLAKHLLETRGISVVICDPSALQLAQGKLRHGDQIIDLVYNRLTDFTLTEPANAVLAEAYISNAAVITPAPHHHALYADKRNLITLSDPMKLTDLGISADDIKTLSAIPKTIAVTPDLADDLWARRKGLFFKPKDGFGSRGAFRGAKLTRRVWGEILDGDYIAQDLIAPPIRAVTVEGAQTALKFDVRVYSYDGAAMLYAARIYQGQTTNLRTAGGGLSAVIPINAAAPCGPNIC